jgi:hypothetical protein
MGFWLIVLGIDAAMGGYLASLWIHGHVALLQGPPQGLHGHGFLAYLAVVAALVAISPWVLLEGRRLAAMIWIVLLDLAVLVVGLRVLGDPQQRFVEWVGLVALYNTSFLYPLLAFHVLGPLLEGRGSARSLEVER